MINSLVDSQIRTDENVRRTEENVRRADENVRRTDESLLGLSLLSIVILAGAKMDSES